MAYNTQNLHSNPSEYVQTDAIDYYDHTTNTENYDDDSDGDSRASSISQPEKILIPTKYRSPSSKPLSDSVSINNRDYQEQTSDYEKKADVRVKILTPTKHRLKELQKLARQKNIDRSQDQSHRSSNENNGFQQQLSENPKQPEQTQPSGYDQLEQWENQNELPTHRNIDPNQSRTLLGRYRITSGDIELRKTPSDTSLYTDESKHTQLQLIFDGIVQAPEVQQRAEHSINDPVNSRTRTPPPSSISPPIRPFETPDSNSPPRSSNGEHRDQRPNNNTYNGDSQFQPGPKINPGTQPYSSGVLPTTVTRNGDYGTYAPPSNNLSSPDEPQGKPKYHSHSSASETNHQRKPFAPSNETKINPKDYNYDGYPEDNRSRSETNTTHPYGTIHSKEKKNLSDSPLSSPPQSPPKPPGYKPKYDFGPKKQNQLSDDDNDESECVTYGQNSQNTPIKKSNVTHNTDNSSRKNLQSPTHNNNSPKPEFQKMADAETTAGDSLTPKQRGPSGASQSTAEEDRDSQSQPRTSPRHQASVAGDYENPGSDPESDSDTPKKQNVTPQQHANSGYSKSNIDNNDKDKRRSNRFDEDVRDNDRRRDVKPDYDGDSNNPGEDHVMQDEPHYQVNDSDDDSPRNSRSAGALIVQANPVRPELKRTQSDEIEPSPPTSKARPKKVKEPEKPKKPGFFARLFGGGNKDEKTRKKKKKTSENKKKDKNKKKGSKKT